MRLPDRSSLVHVAPCSARKSEGTEVMFWPASECSVEGVASDMMRHGSRERGRRAVEGADQRGRESRSSASGQASKKGRNTARWVK
jgi:hypothetical protein